MGIPETQTFVKIVRRDGDITIPADVRRLLGIQKGAIVECQIRVRKHNGETEGKVVPEEN